MPGRSLTLTPASEVRIDPEGCRINETVKRAVREVIPDEWRVLPDGRSTASVIAMHVTREITR